MAGAEAVLTPDFSLYRDHPLAIQIWNTYRNRWLGARWQQLGMTVIPTVGWSNEQSHAFAFAGIAIGSVVAISTVGTNAEARRDTTTARLFEAGYRALVDAVRPRSVLVYGERFPDRLACLAPVVMFSPRTTSMR